MNSTISPTNVLHDLCLAELAAIVSGRLKLGAMPPLGGDCEPVGRIVTRHSQVSEGDVLLAGLEAETQPGQGGPFAEAAFARGAQGVVYAGRTIEPWAGRFAIRVSDTRAALWELAGWARRGFTGKVIAATNCGDDPGLATEVHRLLSQQLRAPSRHSHDGNIAVPMAILDFDISADYGLVQFNLLQDDDSCHLANLSQPDIAIVHDTSASRTVSEVPSPYLSTAFAELMTSLPADGWAILDGDSHRLRQLAEGCPARCVWFGRSRACDVVFTEPPDPRHLPTFTVDGLNFAVQAKHALNVSTLAAACAVGKAMGWHPSTIAAAVVGQSTPSRVPLRRPAA